MIKIIVTLCFMGFVIAQPIDHQQQKDVQIVRDEREVFDDGSYRFVYELTDGQKRDEVGQLTDGALLVTGSYSYVGPDGVTYKVDYVADEEGFRPEGDHIQHVSTQAPVIFIEPLEVHRPELPPPAALPPSAINSLLG